MAIPIIKIWLSKQSCVELKTEMYTVEKKLFE